MRRLWIALCAATIFAAAAAPVEAALVRRSYTVILTPTGDIDLRFLDGDDSGAAPPSIPELGIPIALNDDEADVQLLTACTGGTAPLVYELQFSVTSDTVGFTVLLADAEFDADGQLRITGLTASTQYWLKLACVDDDGRRSDFSTVQSFTTPADPGGADVTAPTLATNVNFTSTVAGEISGTWTNGTDAVGVTVCYITRGTGDGAGNPVGTGTVVSTLTGTPPTPAFTDTGLTPDQQYFHRINCGDAAGNLSGKTAHDYTTVISTPPPGDFIFEANFNNVAWPNDPCWGTNQNPAGNPNVAGNMTRRTSATRGVTPFNGPMLEVRIRANEHLGTEAGIFMSECGDDAQPGDWRHLRFYMAFATGNDWSPKIGYGGKFPGLASLGGLCGTGGNLCDGTDGWTARGTLINYESACATNGRQPVGAYLYYGNDPTPTGHQVIWSGFNTCSNGFVKGQWYCVERAVQLNTLGQSNGIFRDWVDGDQVLNLPGVLHDSTGEFGVDRVFLNVYRGGAAPSLNANDLYLFLDEIVYDDERIGCQ